MKKSFCIILCILVFTACMPCSTFAADAFVPINRDDVISGNGGDVVRDGDIIIDREMGTAYRFCCGPGKELFDRKKLTAFKAKYEYNDKVVTLNLFGKSSSTVDSSSGLFHYASKVDDQGILFYLRDIDCAFAQIDFSDTAFYGYTDNIPESFDITYNWTYDGVSYSRSFTLKPNYKEKSEGLYELSTYKNNGKYVANGTDSSVGMLKRNTEIYVNLPEGDKYFVYSVAGEGTYKFTGCDEDTDGRYFKAYRFDEFNRREYKQVIGSCNAVKVSNVDGFTLGTYHLNFCGENGNTKKVALNVASNFIKGVKVESGTTYATISWDKFDGAVGYSIITDHIEEVSADTLSYTRDNLTPGTLYNYTKIRPELVGQNAGETYVEFVTKPLKTAGLKLSTGSRYIKASWKTSTGAGYHVQVATNAKFTKGKKNYYANGWDTSSKKITRLTYGKKYYVKVREYAIDHNGKKVYGSWSAAKSIVCK